MIPNHKFVHAVLVHQPPPTPIIPSANASVRVGLWVPMRAANLYGFIQNTCNICVGVSSKHQRVNF